MRPLKVSHVHVVPDDASERNHCVVKPAMCICQHDRQLTMWATGDENENRIVTDWGTVNKPVTSCLC